MFELRDRTEDYLRFAPDADAVVFTGAEKLFNYFMGSDD